jgi:endonuclease III
MMESLEKRRAEFLKIFSLAQKKYGKSKYRLAGEGWGKDWRTLMVTIMSAQSRDETTIPIGEYLFRRYGTLEKLASASYDEVLKIFRSLNYNRTKAKNVIAAARFILSEFNGKLPLDLDELVKIPGVGRKTANLVLWECGKIHGICVDTHVHRISNVFGFVDTKTPEKTEMELMKVVPRRLWGKVNRVFVLWGKDVTGWDRERFLSKLREK